MDDFTRPWLHKPGSFDLIFSRSLYGCVNDWSKLLSEALNALEPGGWFESVEVVTSFKSENSPDGELPKDSIIREWCELGIAASAKIGLRLDIAGEVGGWMERVGFVNVQQKEFKVPFGAWPEVGSYN